MCRTLEEVIALARVELAVPAAESLSEVGTLLASWGAVKLPSLTYLERLTDEFVDPELAVSMWTIPDADQLRSHATQEDFALAAEFEREPFDPLEYGPEQLEWTTMSQEMETLKRIIIILQREPDSPTRVGGFRVYGLAGQGYREALWAATGVLPRDPGWPAGRLITQAISLAGREAAWALPRDVDYVSAD